MVERTLRNLSPRFFSLVHEEAQGRLIRDGRASIEHAPARDQQRPAQISALLNREFAELKQTRLQLRDVCLFAAEIFQLCLATHRPLPSSIHQALAITLTFMHHNNIEIKAPELSLFEMALETASQEASAEEFGEFLYEHTGSECKDSVWVVT